MIDGGGIRGHGSLLILRDLMAKIEAKEQRLDRTRSHSSTFVWDPEGSNLNDEIPDSAPSVSSEASESSELGVVGLQKGAPHRPRLPCHYFTYAAGTSTGG